MQNHFSKGQNATSPRWIIGVDTGGTFTDTVVISDAGEIFYSKVSTTPQDLSIGIVESLRTIGRDGGPGIKDLLSSTEKFAHGTTHTVNAYIQYRGAKVGLIVTKGTRDTLAIMRAGRGAGLPESERFHYSRVMKPKPLVPRDLIEEVDERVDHSGKIIVKLNEDDVREAVSRLLEKNVDSIAVCLLWSFRNPSHERTIARIVSEVAPKVPCSISSDLAPIMGEYERMVTVVLNSMLSPILDSYVHTLEQKIRSEGLRVPILLMQSIGGLIPAVEAPRRAVTTLLSGLAGGVVASHYMGTQMGYSNIITSDMGGTSFEVGIIAGGIPISANQPLAPKHGPYISRYTLLSPQIDITAIGAGGGSIAWLDNGIIKVGPLSAGANPGPACYNRGGESPTVTDANLMLGYLNEGNFLGGTMRVSKELAVKALKKVAEPLSIDTVEAAAGIHRVVCDQMADLMRKATIERGYDPRDFVLFAFGGAGPGHCAYYGAELGVSRIIVPGRGLATAHSALGMAISDLKYSTATTWEMNAPAKVDIVNEIFARLEAKSVELLQSWGARRSDIILVRSVDMRYKLQAHVVNVSVEAGELSEMMLEKMYNNFEAKYETLFGKGAAFREAGMELVNFRIDAIGTITKPPLKKFERAGSDPDHALKSKREVFFREHDKFVTTPIYGGEKLRSGNMVLGPSIIEYTGTTVVLPPSYSARVDEYLNLNLSRGQ